MRITCILTLIISSLSALSAQKLFSETIGVVMIRQQKCVVMPRHISKRVDDDRRSSLIGERGTKMPKWIISSELLDGTSKMVSDWIKESYEIEKEMGVYRFTINPVDATICFKTQPEPLELKRVMDGGAFSEDLSEYAYYKMEEEHWVKYRDETEHLWKNIDLKQCSKILNHIDNLYECTENSINHNLKLDHIEQFGEKVNMDSSNKRFTFARHLHANSYVIATRVKKGATMIKGTYFGIGISEFVIDERIFKYELPEKSRTSIGNVAIPLDV